MSGDGHQSSLQEIAADAVGDASNESPPSADSSVFVMRREASTRLQAAIEFSASCSDARNGYEFQPLQAVRGRNDGAERIIVPQEVRAVTTERNASLESHLVTIQTLPNTAWRMASTQLERGCVLLKLVLTGGKMGYFSKVMAKSLRGRGEIRDAQVTTCHTSATNATQLISKVSTHATVNIPRLANVKAWNVMQSLLPSSLV